VDRNDHHNMSFDLYFNNKKVASYHLDPWSSEVDIAFVSSEAREAVKQHIEAHDLITKAKDAYIENALTHLTEKQLTAVLADRDFTVDDVISELAELFSLADEEKKFKAKVKRMCKSSLVVGNDEGYIPLSFDILPPLNQRF